MYAMFTFTCLYNAFVVYYSTIRLHAQLYAMIFALL